MFRKKVDSNEVEYYHSLKSYIDSYPKYIYSLQKFTIEELKEKNYTNDQIDAIKTYDGSKEKTIRASAYVNATLRCTEFRYSSSNDRTYISANFSGKWVSAS